MQLKLRGMTALLIGIIALAFLVAVFIIIGSFFLIIVPVLIVLGIIMFIIRRIIPREKPKPTKKQEYLDAEFKVKG